MTTDTAAGCGHSWCVCPTHQLPATALPPGPHDDPHKEREADDAFEVYASDQVNHRFAFLPALVRRRSPSALGVAGHGQNDRLRDDEDDEQ